MRACITSRWASGAGCGIAAREPLYVIATEPATQRVIVGRNDDLLRARTARAAT